jgi:glycosyltransferase involved in cell wall biosynthesis
MTEIYNSKQILYLSYDGMTDPLGQSQVLPYLIGLTKEGYTFHLISFEKQQRFEQHKEHIQKICDENGIHWYPNKYSPSSPLISTVWDVMQMSKLAFSLHQKYKFEIVHCRSYISALVGLSLKKKKNVKFVFDMRGFWADERVDGGLWSLKHPVFKFVYNFFKKKEIQYFKKSDYTISLTHNGKNEIESWKELKNDLPKIQIIPCCVDLELFNQEKISFDQKNELRNKLNLKQDDFVLGYVGSIGTWYMLPEMLDYFKILKTENPKAKFLFVTGEKPSTIIDLAFEKNISKEDIIITSCLHKEVPLNISIFDTSIFFIRPTFSKKASSPTKQGEIMAMGIPLVCNSGVGDTDFVVEKYSAGKVIKEFNDEIYLKSIQTEIEIDKELIKQGAKEFYSLEAGVKKYLEVYKSLISNI